MFEIRWIKYCYDIWCDKIMNEIHQILIIIITGANKAQQYAIAPHCIVI